MTDPTTFDDWWKANYGNTPIGEDDAVGVTAMLAWDAATRAERERCLRAVYDAAAMLPDAAWAGGVVPAHRLIHLVANTICSGDEIADARPLLREMGRELAKLDPAAGEGAPT